MGNKKSVIVFFAVCVLAIAGLAAIPSRSATTFQSGSQVQGGVPQGTTDSQYPVVVGGNDGSVIRTLHTDSSGQLQVGLSSGATVAVSNLPATFPGAITNIPHVVVDSIPNSSGVVADPCQDVGTLKAGAFKQVAAGSTAEIISLTAGQTIYPCGFLANQVLAGTIQFVTGTGTNCGTGQAAVSAPFGTIANQPYTYVPAMTAMTVPVSQALCLTTTGLTAPAQVQVTFAKK